MKFPGSFANIDAFPAMLPMQAFYEYPLLYNMLSGADFPG